MKQGLFITVEGPEGAGKTTVLEKIYQQLQNDGEKVLLTREPGGIDIAEQIRSVILDQKNTMMDAKTEALLYAAARRQHLVEKVIPFLKDGGIVLCDRFIDSSLAYQGFARGIGIEEILEINQFATDGIFPDVTIFFDIEPELGLERIKKNKGREVNRLDKETINFHFKVYEGYVHVCNRFPERIKKVDAARSFDDVYSDAYGIIMDNLSNKR